MPGRRPLKSAALPGGAQNVPRQRSERGRRILVAAFQVFRHFLAEKQIVRVRNLHAARAPARGSLGIGPAGPRTRLDAPALLAHAREL
eukprot:2283596-Pyramimonas_sp.AAC.1